VLRGKRNPKKRESEYTSEYALGEVLLKE